MFYESQVAICPASAVMEYAEAFFAASDDARRLSVASSEPNASAPSFRAVYDPTDCTGWRKALALRWLDHAPFLLPNFSGELTVRPMCANSQLTIAGSFGREPMSANALLDSIAAAIDRAAMRSLLRQIVSHCETEWISFVNGCPSIAMCNERSTKSVAQGAGSAPQYAESRSS